MKKLNELINSLESRINDQEIINPGISKVTVGWHIEHALLTSDLIIEALCKSNPREYKRRFDYRRIVVILLGIIPRGRIRAPKAVQPVNTFNVATLKQHVFNSREKLKALESLSPGHYFTHPFLGDFKLKQAIRFISVHTRHHVNIINDIVGSDN